MKPGAERSAGAQREPDEVSMETKEKPRKPLIEVISSQDAEEVEEVEKRTGEKQKAKAEVQKETPGRTSETEGREKSGVGGTQGMEEEGKESEDSPELKQALEELMDPLGESITTQANTHSTRA